MSIIQVALTVAVILIGVYMYRRLRSTLLDVILIFLFMGASVFLVLFPDFSHKIAHAVGVGRGADLIFYLGFLFLFFLVLKLYARLRRMEQTFTEIVRKKSMEEAEDRLPQDH
jgi:hypothetical protein